MSSDTELAGNDGFATRTNGTAATSEIGEKSTSGS
jgi:hypothetical protein